MPAAATMLRAVPRRAGTTRSATTVMCSTVPNPLLTPAQNEYIGAIQVESIVTSAAVPAASGPRWRTKPDIQARPGSSSFSPSAMNWTAMAASKSPSMRVAMFSPV